MWKVLAKRTILGLLSVLGVVGLSIWMDASYNSANLLRRATEHCLSSNNISVRIDSITPNYLDRSFILKGLEIDIKTSSVFKIDQAVCSISLHTIPLFTLTASVDFSNVHSPLIPNLYFAKVKALCSLELLKRKHFASFLDHQNNEIGKVLVHPGKIEVELNQNDPSEPIQVSGTLSFIQQKDSYHIQSCGNIDGMNVAMSEIGKVLNFIPKIKCDISACSWEIDYVNKGKEEISNFQNLKLNAKLLNCFGSKNLVPIKQIMASVDLQDNKFVCVASSEEFGKGKNHVINLEYKNGEIFGSGLLDSSFAFLLKRLLCTEEGLFNFVFEKKLRWSYLQNIQNAEFVFDIEGEFSKAEMFILGRHTVVSDIVARASFESDLWKIGAKGVLPNLDAKIGYNGTFDKQGAHKAELNLHLSKTIQTSTFRIEPGFAHLKCEITKDENYGYKFWGDCDLTKLGLCYEKMAFTKGVDQNLILKINGVAFGGSAFFNFNVEGADDLAIDGYCRVNGSRTFLDFQNVCYNRNSYGLKIDISPKGIKAHIKGEVLDLLEASLLDWVKPVFQNTESQLIVEVDFMHMKNGKTVSNVNLESFYNGAYYTNSMFQGYLDSGAFVNVMLKSFDEQSIEEKWAFCSDNTGEVLSALGLYDGMDFGVLKIDFTTNRSEVSKDNVYPFISGEVKIGKFQLKESPHPILTLLCPSILLRPFSKTKYFVFDSLVSNFYVDKGTLNIEKALAQSFSHAVSVRNVQISSDGAPITISGEIAPSWYGVGTIVRSIPILGQMVNRMKLPGFWLPYKVQIQL
jgi:hypothetical protein